MLNDIYELLPQDVIDFNTLNALPENNQGPQVPSMSYQNSANESSVKMDLTGTPSAVIPSGFIFSDVPGANIWVISTPTTLNVSGVATGVRAKCLTDGPIEAPSGTLVKIIIPGDVSAITNPFNAVVGGEEFLQCVDKSTIDDPTYQPWTDAMEANQPIATREVITITLE